MSSSSDEEYFDCPEPTKYFVVLFPKNKEKGLVTTDMNEVKMKLKNVKGSRFAIFYDLIEAEKHCKGYLADDSELAKDKSKLYTESFSDVSTINLTKFKDAINEGDVEKCKKIISDNPRNLVTQCNIPSLLQGMRFHYNALHVAVSSNKPDIVKLIIDSISQDDFWKRIYPNVDDISNQEAKFRVTDLLLNSPERNKSETPLHLAAKFGHTECIRLLLNEELTDRNIKNNDEMRAEDIICTRYDKPDKNEKCLEIKEMFSEKYVVLIEGNQDKIEVLQPLNHCELMKLLRACNELYRTNNHNSIMTTFDNSFINKVRSVRAYIGPLPQIKAEQVRRRWSILNAGDAIKFEVIRRKDAEKGFECHGRYLAQVFGAPWKEFWSFLNCYIDLSSEEGLSKFETFLEDAKTTQLILNEEVSVTEERSKYHDAYSSLVNLFSRLTLNSFLKHNSVSSPIKNNVSKFQSPFKEQYNFSTSTPMRQPLSKNNRGAQTPSDRNLNHKSISINQCMSLRSIRLPFNTSIEGCGVLTPSDRQVRKAILSTSKGKYLKFPHISSWVSEMSIVDPVETDDKSKFITSTPLKRKTIVDNDVSNILSPFSQIELQDD